jgi:3-hydroxyacyl-CoA dehydrogenase
VEVKIGIQSAPRELVVETTASPEEIEKQLARALGTEGSVFALADEKGARVLIPADKIAYVELASPESRRMGFGAYS